MKQLILLTSLMEGLLPVAAQNPTCQSGRTGTFEMVTSGGMRTHITRTVIRQVEQVANSSQPTSYRVKWLDDCTYELLPEASFFAKYPSAPLTARLRAYGQLVLRYGT